MHSMHTHIGFALVALVVGVTVDDMLVAPTEDGLFSQMISWLVQLGLPADQWRAGGVSRSLLRVVARTFVSLAGLITDFITGGFLETATGDWLTLLARNVYGVVRITASFASGQWTATNGGAGIYIIGPGDLIVKSSVSGKLFNNRNQVGNVTLNPGDSYTFTIDAVELGTASNAAPGDISLLASNFAGLTGSNVAAVLATDDESDSDLRQACLDKLAALSLNGPRGAYAYAIRIATNAGAPVNVNRKSISPSSSTGIVTIYLASPSGTVSSGDLAAVQTSIEAVARPDSVTTNVLSAAQVNYTATLTVWARATPGLDATSLTALVNAAIEAYVEGYDIGGIPKPPSTQGYLYAQALEAAAEDAHAAIYAVDSSAGDLALNAGQVAALATTINIRFTTTAAT
jgi:hypothetical protein